MAAYEESSDQGDSNLDKADVGTLRLSAGTSRHSAGDDRGALVEGTVLDVDRMAQQEGIRLAGEVLHFEAPRFRQGTQWSMDVGGTSPRGGI